MTKVSRCYNNDTTVWSLILEPNANAIAPPTPEPTIIDGITRNGSAATWNCTLSDE